MKKKHISGILIVLILLAGSLFLLNQYQGGSNINYTGFDRNLNPLIFTKHAKCRMACRHIDESEIREILHKGKINFDKSEPDAKPDPKFALEGTTHDNQQVRVIFAPSHRGMVVITCIDLNTEWQCDCR
ncbi:MAG: DUF4258 domain-containing protein [Bacteroidetes bacterium]|nr:DUF4258 domain-containing protein [Bacteroidota bacterium]